MKLAEAREAMAEFLRGVLPDEIGVIDHLPDAVAPPVVLVAWSDPMVKPSTLCQYVAAMELITVAQRLEPGGNLETLEEMVSAIVPAMKGQQYFQVIDVTSPYPINIGGVDYLATSINVTHDVEE